MPAAPSVSVHYRLQVLQLQVSCHLLLKLWLVRKLKPPALAVDLVNSKLHGPRMAQPVSHAKRGGGERANDPMLAEKRVC